MIDTAHNTAILDQCEQNRLYPVPEAAVIGYCEACGKDICAGEDYYDFYGDIVCEDCVIKYIEQFRRVAG